MKIVKRNSITLIVLIGVFMSLCTLVITQEHDKINIESDQEIISNQLYLCSHHILCIDIKESENATCQQDGYIFYRCNQCDYIKLIITQKSNHIFKEIENTQPTCVSDGKVVVKCKNCDILKNTHLEKLGHKLTPSEPVVNDKGSLCLKRKCTRCEYAISHTIEKNFSKVNSYICNLISEDLGINVPVCNAMVSNKTPQQLTDKKYCATYLYLQRKMIVADHKHQGFDKIKKSIVGETILTFDQKTFVCIDKFNGINTGSCITDLNGVVVDDSREGDLLLYTCNSNWKDITVTLWKCVD